ncbi:MAG: formylglycine-generating enzyme family protein [Verrucomicrobiota bacterium]
MKLASVLTLLTLSIVRLPAAEPAAVPVGELAKNANLLEAGEVGKVLTVQLPGDLLMKFVWCPPGTFVMGSPPGEDGRMTDEDQVQVRISKGFWLGQTEVTQAQWQAVMGTTFEQQVEKTGTTGWIKGMGDDHPMYFVNWDDAQSFVNKLGDEAGLSAAWKCTLPTEAQWEYACRAGTTSTFSFGNTLTSLQANIDPRNVFQPKTLKEVAVEKTCAVGSYPANAWGLYDMHGNVHEWCLDLRYDTLVGGTDPVGTGPHTYRVFRGGAWNGNAYRCRSACRYAEPPICRGPSQGFRIALVQIK